jgi:hypothetical protein
MAMSHTEVERRAIAHVMDLERQYDRQPQDVSKRKDTPYDVFSPPRKIEVKAFGGSARGEAIALEDSQYQAALGDPDNFYLYVVDNVAADGKGQVRVLHGPMLRAMLERTAPRKTYWPTFRTAEYDSAPLVDAEPLPQDASEA